MSHKVRVNAGQVQIALPDKNVYNGPIDVVLTDEQFAKIRPALFPSVLTDLGPLADPALDASFATDNELAAAINTARTITPGLLAARPSAAAFGVGIYNATDVNGGTLYYSNGITWTPVTAGTLPVGTTIASASITTAVSLALGAFTDVPGLSMTVPVGIPFRVGMQWKPTISQGTAVAGSKPAIQIRAVNAAATTAYWFDTSQITFSGASGGNYLGQMARSLGPAQAALGTALVVKTQGFVTNIAGLAASGLDTAFNSMPIELFAVSI